MTTGPPTTFFWWARSCSKDSQDGLRLALVGQTDDAINLKWLSPLSDGDRFLREVISVLSIWLSNLSLKKTDLTDWCNDQFWVHRHDQPRRIIALDGQCRSRSLRWLLRKSHSSSSFIDETFDHFHWSWSFETWRWNRYYDWELLSKTSHRWVDHLHVLSRASERPDCDQNQWWIEARQGWDWS